MSKTVKLSSGEATFSEVVTYSLKKRINAELFHGRNFDLREGVASVPYEALEESRNLGILGLLEKLTIGGKDVKIDGECFDGLLASDYDILAATAAGILNPPDETKKKKG